MFDSIINFFKKFSKENKDSKDTAKERLHLVLMQDRANVSADFLEMMKQEIIEVIKKYIDVDENSIDVKLTNKVNSDGTTGAPALYANIPIMSLKDETKKVSIERKKENLEAKSVKNSEEQERILVHENVEKQENIREEKSEEIEKNKEIVVENLKNNKEEKENETTEETNSNSKENTENEQKENSKSENKKGENNQIENKEAKSEEPNEEKKEE
ncbi:MAG: cell division topological specificity factor MinE [Clostridia bacterium]|nr:cell division topological specificity factor MinE [Clostridia bacterium]